MAPRIRHSRVPGTPGFPEHRFEGTWRPVDLGTGTPDATRFLRGDGTWAVPPAGISDAPNDGVAYVRRNLAWESGDTRFAALSHPHAAADITSGTLATARLGTGTADGTTFLRGDQTWAAPPAAPAFSGALVQRTNNFSITNTSVFDIPWESEVYDTDNYWDSGTPTRFTVPADGYYRFSASISWSGTSTASGLIIQSAAGGTLGAVQANIPAAAGAPLPLHSAVVYLTSGSQWRASMYVNAQPRTLVAEARTWFGVHRVR